ncbi:type II CAAX endopeptidase family protein [Desulfosporosinus sp. FKB]|uniref:CPBP family intramembrane glutamic endopeptidase n=1 Tax=Desulfosporosinus sp. FKB TaxID=1969835 RepID=UPI000B49A37D|nr:type II CAAX endopeptidase family protein [Desulfosporosinus sp. FKB]
MANKVKKKDSLIPPRHPVWNIWQGLFLIALVTLLEFPLGWLETPKDLVSIPGVIRFLGVGLGDVFLYITVIWVFMRLIRRPFSDLGFVRPSKRFLLLGLGAGFFLFFSIGLLGNELTKILGIPAPQSFALAVKGASYPWEFALLTLLGGVIAPIKEEMLFRGLIYPPLREANGKGRGIILTGIFFAMLHFDLIRFLPLFLGGIVLTWLYERSSSIWPSVVAHGTWNILMALALWIQRY